MMALLLIPVGIFVALTFCIAVFSHHPLLLWITRPLRILLFVLRFRTRWYVARYHVTWGEQHVVCDVCQDYFKPEEGSYDKGYYAYCPHCYHKPNKEVLR